MSRTRLREAQPDLKPVKAEFTGPQPYLGGASAVNDWTTSRAIPASKVSPLATSRQSTGCYGRAQPSITAGGDVAATSRAHRVDEMFHVKPRRIRSLTIFDHWSETATPKVCTIRCRSCILANSTTMRPLRLPS